MSATTQAPPTLRRWVPGALAGSGAALLGWVALDAVSAMWPRALPPETLALTVVVAASTVVVASYADAGAARWALLVTTAAIVLGIAAGAADPVSVQVRHWNANPLDILARGAHSMGPYVLLGVWAALSVAGVLKAPRDGRG